MNRDKARDKIFKESEDVEGIHVRGYSFADGLDMKDFIESLKSTGFQASHLGKAIDIAKKMRKDGVTIFLGFTSNMIQGIK